MSATKASLRVYDTGKNLLGTVESGPPSSSPFVGVETDSPFGISEVVIDGNLVAVDELILEYLAPHLFVTYVGQIGDGVAAGRNVQTELVILNRTSSTAEGSVEFCDSGGQPLPLFLQGEGTTETPRVQTDFRVAPLSSLRIRTAGKGLVPSETPGPSVLLPASGYAQIQSRVPIDVRAVYVSVEQDTGRVSEAGIASSTGWTSALADVENSLATGTAAALALVNTEDTAVEVSISLRDVPGASRILTLDPHEHRAQFISELFPEIDVSNLSGSLLIFANGRVTGVALRTQDGFPTAGLALSAAEEGR